MNIICPFCISVSVYGIFDLPERLASMLVRQAFNVQLFNNSYDNSVF